MSENSMIQELIKKSRIALKKMEDCTQEQVDQMCRAIHFSVAEHAEELAKEAVQETGMGNVEDKIVKNVTTGSGIWTVMKNKKSVGIIGEDKEKQMIYVAHPKGIIAGIAPTTNPTITPLGNAMLALKGRNVIIVSPHPRSKNTSKHTVEIMNEALKKINAPENVIQIIEDPSIEATQELMKLSDVIVATGGMGMVHAAYSSGKPAYGVGQGNVQRIIADDYKDFDKAAKDVIAGRSFDNGLICAGDQSVIVQKDDEKAMIEALVRNGAFYCNDENIVAKFRNVVFVNGKLNAKVVGKSAEFIGNLAGVEVPKDTKIVLLKVKKYGAEEVLCGEKLCPITVELAYNTFKEGVDIAKANLLYQGAGHSAGIHSNKREYIEYAGVVLPVSRLVVNVFGIAAGGAGLATYLNPTPSLGCGSWGGNSISENLTYEHLINVSRIAFPRKGNPPTDEEIWS